MKCPKCQYEHKPEPQALQKFFNDEKVEWIGDESFENVLFNGQISEIYAKQCPKCKSIFIWVTENKYFLLMKE